MNWGEFKKYVESEGVKDETVIDYIDTIGDEVLAVDIKEGGVCIVGCD